MSESVSDLQSQIAQSIDAHKNRPGALLPILNSIQDGLGYVPGEAVPAIATALNLSRAEVHGVITFYHWYRREAPGRHVMHVCRAEACQAMGGRAVEQRLKSALGIDYHQTSSDGAVTLEPAYCLGHCARSPAVLIDGEPRASLTPESAERLVDELRAS